MGKPFKNSHIEVQYDNEVAIVSLNRPNKRNALTAQIREELSNLFGEFTNNKKIRAVVLASKAAAFSAGQDLSESKKFSPNQIPEWIDEHMKLYKTILSHPTPVLAAIDGCCVGAGFQMALMCDLRIGSEESFFAMPELDDAIPCILGIWSLWDALGRSRTAEIVLTNRRVLANEALKWGILNQVVTKDRLLPHTIELARNLANKPALAFRLTKKCLCTLALKDTQDFLMQAYYAHTLAFGSGEPQKVMQAFLDKTPKLLSASSDSKIDL